MIDQYVLDRQKLETHLLEKGYGSLQEFVEKAGIHRNSLNDYLYGKKTVFCRVLEKMAATLEVDPLEIIQKKKNYIEQLPGPLQKRIKMLGISFSHLAFTLIGSRARGSAKKHSDWDIGFTGGPDGLGTDTYLRVKSMFQNLTDDLVFSTQLVNLDQAPDWFLEDMDYKPIFLAGNEKAYFYFMGKFDEIQKSKVA
jgi:transcriptional regulator with XRE-family HTH domain